MASSGRAGSATNTSLASSPCLSPPPSLSSPAAAPTSSPCPPVPHSTRLNSTQRAPPPLSRRRFAFSEFPFWRQFAFWDFTGGRVFSWGRGSSGQLGHGEVTSSCLTPKAVTSLEGYFITSVSAGWSNSGFVSGDQLFFFSLFPAFHSRVVKRQIPCFPGRSVCHVQVR